MITKIAKVTEAYRREFNYTNSARTAWSNIIEKYNADYPNGIILLPSYIGWSANEGSGIFDSVLNSGMSYDFYTLDGQLKIDFADLQAKTGKYQERLVLLVHYFGFMDNQYEVITDWLDTNNVHYVEDCAHAWLSDLIGGVCGRKGKHSFYSLHKLLPLAEGGLEVINNPKNKTKGINSFLDLGYDLYTIYEIRRKNYIHLLKLLLDVKGIDIIYKELPDGICPQTLPVIVLNYDRNKLYQEMNEAGFGMVSLYHTMIEQLADYNSEAASVLSQKIINFPIHQDVRLEQLEQLVAKLKEILYA